ncbi:uncharacterized protein DDB_G0292642 [Papilio machaon]|uniref:uncharacterized protein DDB_G0292642 n=1 Tax=Papilio machaon TaxID=76193 RepID=UPI001E665E72|nr:uncharacterized protein DDB_G0292642 [Papilio machaon]XP_014361609.2 uncharacterized protein DDB_G0292642 [Papilio machaon]
MNGDIKAEAPRPRPLSGGIWTLFSWLRRDDRSISSESLSSAGSDHTAVSFAFLEPLNYKAATEPIVLPPLSPPTDSYKKRVRDRNFRRQRERNLTLHRKYGLFKGENGDRYDAFSLPSERKYITDGGNNIERGRRATSESFQRRAPYVPGKRRAPLPPAITASLPRNFSRKRPAPQPPNRLIVDDSVTLRSGLMNPKPNCDRRSLPNNVSMDINIEKSKQEKIKTDKSFLKQIFENRKRNSAIEPNYVKLLPNISELDKQAAKIIENKKLKLLEAKGTVSVNDIGSDPSGNWICAQCLRNYNNAVSSCSYCLLTKKYSEKASENNLSISNAASNIYTQTDNDLTKIGSTSKRNEEEEKKKLKEMLKEMKDSLPKRPKQNVLSTESPTLRIGSPRNKRISDPPTKNGSTSKKLDVTVTKDDIIPPSTSGKQNSLHSQIKSDSLNQNSTLLISNNTESKKVSSIPLMNKNLHDIPNVINYKEDSRHITIQVKESLLKTQKDVEDTEKVKRFQPTHQNTLLDNAVTQASSDVKAQTSSPLKLNMSTDEKHKNLTTVLFVSEGSRTKPIENLGNPKPEVTLTKTSNKKLPTNGKTEKTDIDISTVPATDTRVNYLDKNVKSTKSIEVKTNEDNFKVSTMSSAPSLHTPLRISSLLNPVYRPITSPKSASEANLKNIIGTKSDVVTLSSAVISQPPTVLINQRSLMPIEEISEPSEKETEDKQLQSLSFTKSQYSTNTSVCKVLGVTPSSSKDKQDKGVSKAEHHIRRRQLVNQLEQSIATGDEQAAAEAAVKLAKLRLSCSVLSFSSQIIGNPAVPRIIDSNPEFEEKDDKSMKSGSKNDPVQVKVNNESPKRKDSPEQKSPLTCLNKTGEHENTNRPSTSKYQGGISKEDKSVMSQIDLKHKIPASKSSHVENKIMAIKIWVEDKETTRGPIQFRISRQATMGELRGQAEASLGLDSRLQRWIVGRTLCMNDSTPLTTLAGPDLSAPFYLCIVESETKKEVTGNDSRDSKDDQSNEMIPDNGTGDVYTELMKLEQQAIVPNMDAFECGVCIDECEAGRGVVLRECIHTFCRDCLADVVRHCEEAAVSCPAIGCPGMLQEREIRALLSTEEYERWLARGLATAECGTRNAFHCRTRDCTGWALCEPGVRKFPCPVCKCNNCVPCQAIHDGETCEHYQTKLRTAVTAAQTNETDEGTRVLLDSLKRRGEALECPECSAIITKKWGCDWVKCSACKTEICWVTRGRRWGPGGRGDTSAGCRCGVEGKRCHPSCGYCH